MSNVFYETLEKCASARMEKWALSPADLGKMMRNTSHNPASKLSLGQANAMKRNFQMMGSNVNRGIGRPNAQAFKNRMHSAAKSLRG